jgi:acyl-CoA synthetase (AMP-forming)/AMP-acid ligase II
MSPIAPSTALLPEILSLNGRWRANAPALVCGDCILKWSEFNLHLNRVANALLALGLKKGDRVGVVMGNGIEMAETLFGVMKAGCVSVPINLSVTDEAISVMLDDSRARALIATADQAQRIDDAGISGEALDAGRRVATGEPRHGWLCYANWVAGQPDIEPEIDIRSGDPLNIIYSSGTTGAPKGICHNHESRLNFGRHLAISLRYEGKVNTLITLGMYSNISWVSMLCTFLTGGCIHIHRRFDPVETLRAIQDQQITHTSMVPLQYRQLVEAQRKHGFDLGSFRAPMSCGSPLQPELKQQVMTEISSGIIELYGLTEGPITTIDPEDSDSHEGSVGLPVAGGDIRILDDDDRDVGSDESGEIVGRCAYMMTGYHNQPEATAACTWIDSKNRAWLRTGDIGRFDKDGFLYIVGRKKDMILSGGQNIYPEDIEAVIIHHEAVYEVAVIGVNSRKWGETPMAVIVPEAGTSPDQAEIVDWCNSRLGKQQRIAGVQFCEELPRNANGKVLKRELREQFSDVLYD